MTHVQEPIGVEIGHALEYLLHDGLDLVLVQSSSSPLRRTRSPLEDAEKRPALYQWSDDRDTRMIRRKGEHREYTAGQSRLAGDSP